MCLEILASKSPINGVPKHVVIPFKFSEDNTAIDYFSELLTEGIFFFQIYNLQFVTALYKLFGILMKHI